MTPEAFYHLRAEAVSLGGGIIHWLGQRYMVEKSTSPGGSPDGWQCRMLTTVDARENHTS